MDITTLAAAKAYTDKRISEIEEKAEKEEKELLDKATKSDINGYLVIIFNKMLKMKEKKLSNVKK